MRQIRNSGRTRWWKYSSWTSHSKDSITQELWCGLQLIRTFQGNFCRKKKINEVLNAPHKWFQILMVFSLSLVLAALATGMEAVSYITTLLSPLQTPSQTFVIWHSEVLFEMWLVWYLHSICKEMGLKRLRDLLKVPQQANWKGRYLLLAFLLSFIEYRPCTGTKWEVIPIFYKVFTNPFKLRIAIIFLIINTQRG